QRVGYEPPFALLAEAVVLDDGRHVQEDGIELREQLVALVTGLRTRRAERIEEHRDEVARDPLVLAEVIDAAKEAPAVVAGERAALDEPLEVLDREQDLREIVRRGEFREPQRSGREDAPHAFEVGVVEQMLRGIALEDLARGQARNRERGVQAILNR